MKSLKNFFAVTFGVMGALILAPFVAFFGLMMLGLAFGLSIIAAGAVTSMARQAEAPEPVADTAADRPEPDAETAATPA